MTTSPAPSTSNPATTQYPPTAIDSERFILGEMLFDISAADELGPVLTGEMFFTHQHQEIFKGIAAARSADNAPDPYTVAGLISDVKPAQLVDMIDGFSGIPMDRETHLKNIVEAYTMRRMIADAREVIKHCYTTGARAAEALQMLHIAARTADEICQSSNPEDQAVDLKHYNKTFLEWLFAEDEEKLTDPGITTGLQELDKTLINIHAGALMVIGASPGTGKTALFLNMMAHELATKKACNGLFFSVEMPTAEIYQRCIAYGANVELNNIRKREISEAEAARVVSAGALYERSNIRVDPDGSINIDQIRARCREYEREYKKIDVIGVDYIQIVDAISAKGESRADELGKIAKGLKAIAKEFRTPVVALSQLSRPPKTNPNRRPRKEDLRDSGSIEAAADIVVLLHEMPEHGENTIEAIIDKNRSGAKGSAWLHFEGQYMKFSSSSDDRLPKDGDQFTAIPEGIIDDF